MENQLTFMYCLAGANEYPSLEDYKKVLLERLLGKHPDATVEEIIAIHHVGEGSSNWKLSWNPENWETRMHFAFPK
jgi:hypothetical protein